MDSEHIRSGLPSCDRWSPGRIARPRDTPGSAWSRTPNIPRLRDDAGGHSIHVLGVDRPTPRTRRTGETILVVDRADADYVQVGRLWTAE